MAQSMHPQPSDDSFVIKKRNARVAYTVNTSDTSLSQNETGYVIYNILCGEDRISNCYHFVPVSLLYKS